MPRPTTRRILLLTTSTLLLTGVAAGATLEPCDGTRYGGRADCGTLSVLEDRSRPDGRRIDLDLVVLRAEESGGLEPVFLLAGGPGQGATDLAGLVTHLFAPVRRTRDFVLVDQRGTVDRIR